MNARKLQFGKALSAALFVLLLSVVGMKNALAQTQVATLQHGDDVSAFYGGNAFVQAHTAAADGDIITLSSGTFAVPDQVTKAITLRGAGPVTDTVAGTAPTIFISTVNLNVANDSIPLIVEGILFSTTMNYYTLVNPKFTRCNFNRIDYWSGGNMSNAQFVNCIIKQFAFFQANGTTLINSVVWEPSNIGQSHTVTLFNSIMGNASNVGGLSAYNSIFVRSSGSPQSTSTFSNCIGINTYSGSNSYGAFGQAYTSGCVEYTSYEDVFESFAGTFSFDEAFALKEEIATGFHGSDGTQAGIYGGPLPYSSRPGYMVLKRCNVAGRSTIDGKLSVDIEVVTEGE